VTGVTGRLKTPRQQSGKQDGKDRIRASIFGKKKQSPGRSSNVPVLNLAARRVAEIEAAIGREKMPQ